MLIVEGLKMLNHITRTVTVHKMLQKTKCIIDNSGILQLFTEYNKITVYKMFIQLQRNTQCYSYWMKSYSAQNVHKMCTKCAQNHMATKCVTSDKHIVIRCYS